MMWSNGAGSVQEIDVNAESFFITGSACNVADGTRNSSTLSDNATHIALCGTDLCHDSVIAI